MLKSHNKLQITPIKNKILLQKREKHVILAKNTANAVFWQNHGIWRKSWFPWFPCFRDFLLSLIIVNGPNVAVLHRLPNTSVKVTTVTTRVAVLQGWYCVQQCLFATVWMFVCLFVCQHGNSWAVRDIMTKFSGQQPMVKREAAYKNGVHGWWFNVSNVLLFKSGAPWRITMKQARRRHGSASLKSSPLVSGGLKSWCWYYRMTELKGLI